MKQINTIGQLKAEWQGHLYHNWRTLSYFYPKRNSHCSCMSHLQCEQPIFKLNFLGKKIRTNGSLILITKLTIHIPTRREEEQWSWWYKSNKRILIRPFLTVVNKIFLKKIPNSKFRAYWFISDVLPTLPKEKRNQINYH